MQPTTHHPVAIIGGGIAGLSAAWALQKAGIDYVLLEQEARCRAARFARADGRRLRR